MREGWGDYVDELILGEGDLSIGHVRRVGSKGFAWSSGFQWGSPSGSAMRRGILEL